MRNLEKFNEILIKETAGSDEKVLHAHWNTALTTLNTERTFPIQDIKTQFFNQLYLNRFSSAFGIDTESDKYANCSHGAKSQRKLLPNY